MLTMAIYFLSQHPAVLQKLRAEILGEVGPHRRPTYDDIRDMKYLRAVINGEFSAPGARFCTNGTYLVTETLRLYPAV